jgi:hypothetical protein
LTIWWREGELLKSADNAAGFIACFEEEVAQLRLSASNKRTQSVPDEN